MSGLPGLADGVIIVDEQGEHDDATLRARVADVAACVGEGHGRRVAILASPGAEFVAALFGVLSSGACAVVLSPLHPAVESAFFCDDADVAFLLVTRDQVERARTFAGERAIVVIADLPRAVARASSSTGDSPALMLYTSGTTGKPKGAVLTHDNLSVQRALLAETWGLTHSDVLLHVLPLHHMHGLCIALLSCLAAGAKVRMLPRFDATAIFEDMSRSTVFMAVPTMYKKLLEAFDAADADARARWARNASSLRLATSGSAALPVTLAERWRSLAGRVPLERFGMTEIGVGLSNPLDGERRTGTVGLPLRTVETRVDEGTGELMIRGPSVFRGYFRRDDATARAFRDGWFLTGDTVTRDERGYFRILGRTSVDILKSGGYKLSALEIEEALREHAAVSDVAVVGIPDETWGDRVVACVVVRAGHTLEPEELRSFAKERLSSYKCPKDVVILEDLPRNAMGKVQKTALVGIVQQRTS